MCDADSAARSPRRATTKPSRSPRRASPTSRTATRRTRRACRARRSAPSSATACSRYIEKGKEEGARVVVGGGRPAQFEKGYFVEPTLFADVDNSMTIAREEIFGPVLVVIPFEDDDDAVRIANDNQYGLGGYVTSGSVERATGGRTPAPGRHHQPQRRDLLRRRRTVRRLQGQRRRSSERHRGLSAVPRDARPSPPVSPDPRHREVNQAPRVTARRAKGSNSCKLVSRVHASARTKNIARKTPSRAPRARLRLMDEREDIGSCQPLVNRRRAGSADSALIASPTDRAHAPRRTEGRTAWWPGVRGIRSTRTGTRTTSSS